LNRRKVAAVLFGIGVIIWLAAMAFGLMHHHTIGLMASAVAIAVFVSIVVMIALPEQAERGS
jgi:hypothetical protein